MILAAEFSPPSQWAAYTACVAFSLFLLNEAFKFKRNMGGEKPTPPNGELHLSDSHLRERVDRLEKQLAVADESCAEGVRQVEEKLANEVKEIRELIHTNHDKAMEVASIRGRTIYEKMDNLRSDLEGRFEKLEENVESMPERIVQLFKNIKDLSK